MGACGVDAAAVQHTGNGVLKCGCLHINLAAVCNDGAVCAVVHMGIDLGRCEFEFDASAGSEGDFDGFCSAEQGCASLGFDFSFVGDLGSQQCNIAAACVYGALVAHFGGAAVAFKVHVAGQKVAVCDAQRAGCERRSADAAVFAKENPIRIDEYNVAVGFDLTQYGAGLCANHAVQQHGCFGWLGDINPGVRCDIEALPMDDGFVAALNHVQLRRAGVPDGYLAMLYCGARRKTLRPTELT